MSETHTETTTEATSTVSPLPPKMTLPQSHEARRVLEVLTGLQSKFRNGLDAHAERFGDGRSLEHTSWLRDEGQHGGGWRYEGTDRGILNRGSLNISSVHYDDLPDKRLSSATALSCIVHPSHPRAPSLHTHISWTELRSGEGGGWRFMADLNPSLPRDDHRDRFLSDLTTRLSEVLSQEWVDHALAQGDRYFWIPTLDRHRGVAHIYLEQWRGEDADADLALAQRFGAQVIETYLALLDDALSDAPAPTQSELEAQRAYHSAYWLQVLTLDRGTSSGLLVHRQNDVGILGSLPQRVDRALLTSWVTRLPSPQDELLRSLIETLPSGSICELTPSIRGALAEVVRAHYKAHPEALAFQARGDVLPPTIANHQSEQQVDRPLP